MAILGDKASKIKMIEQFMKDVDEGLSSPNKHLSSKYFYDRIGDELFVKIMDLPEYYLTRAEFEIFSEKTDELINALACKKNVYFELIELGAGDGSKTIQLLRRLLEGNYKFSYLPVDISINALRGLQSRLEKELPGLDVKPQQGDYFKVLSTLKDSSHPKIVLFLGSNIGNLIDELASKFIYELGANLSENDKVLLGVDLIKSKEVVLPAYDDAQGVTRDFNLNLLRRINNELGANFNLDLFEHLVKYDEKEGIVKSYLRSMADQVVAIASLGKSFTFDKGETIHTEISRKYNEEVIRSILAGTDFRILSKITDSRGYFADYILERGA